MSHSDQRLALLEAAVEQSFNSVLITDAQMTGGGPFIVYANPAFCAMTAYTPEQLLGESPRILQGPDTDPEVIQRLRLCLKEHRFFEGSTVNYRSDGSSYVVRWNISPVQDESGTVTHFVSVQQNISQRVRAEQDRDLLAQALNAAPDPIFITDRSSTIIFANEAFHLLTGYDIDDIIGRKTSILHSTNHDEAFFVHFKKSQQKNKALRTIFTNKHRNGSLFYTEQSISALLNSQGEITHYVSISRDVSERFVREKKLREIANRDPLTGLYNRRAGEQALEQHVSAFNYSGVQFCLIICDIDHFKSINDHYGHTAGDGVLKSMAEVVVNLIREKDIAIRWGGEEFLIIIPDSSLQQGILLAERIRKGVEEMKPEETGPVTLSLGVAGLKKEETLQSLIERADTALYEAKRTGRNKVVWAEK